MKLLEDKGGAFSSITVMIQKEVADRIRSAPGTKEYGALTLAVSYYAEPESVMIVKPSCFLPRPGVDSCVICMRARQEPPVKTQENIMFAIIRAAFNQRRKTLANAVSHGFSLDGNSFSREQITNALEEMGLSPSVRGEALSLAEFAELTNRLCEGHR